MLPRSNVQVPLGPLEVRQQVAGHQVLAPKAACRCGPHNFPGKRGGRAYVWTLTAAAVLVATVAPVLYESECQPRESSARLDILRGPQLIGVPRFGSHLLQACMSGVLLAVFLDPQGRFDRSESMHRWTLAYALSVHTQTVFAVVLRPWNLVTCMHGANPVAGVVAGMNVFSYLTSQAILCSIAAKRLRIVAPGPGTLRATRLFKGVFVFGALTALGVCLAETHVLPDALLVVRLLGARFVLYVWCPGSMFLLLYILFQVQVLLSFRRASHEAWLESTASTADNKEEQAMARHATATVYLLAASALSTIVLLTATAAFIAFPRQLLPGWIFEIAFSVNLPFDVGLALVCAGLVGPAGDRRSTLIEIRRLAVQNRVRRAKEKLTGAAHAASGPALTLAALFGGEDPELLIESAIERFRCISWDTLRQRPEVLTQGGTLDGTHASPDLYGLSSPCALGECDVFLSHSWHDDALAKWEALHDWCEDFRARHGRAPRLWLDKVCIDQTQIQTDLACLPIFLSGCSGLLVVSGTTYTSRLWCCVELFVYTQMCMEDDDTDQKPNIFFLCAGSTGHEDMVEQWQQFDANACRCFKERDKARIFSIISSFPGGVEAFNDHVKRIAVQLFESSPTSYPSLGTLGAGSPLALSDFSRALSWLSSSSSIHLASKSLPASQSLSPPARHDADDVESRALVL